MYDIICLGSAGIDMFLDCNKREFNFRKGEKILVEKSKLTTGGGGTNTSVGFSRLGLRTGFIGVVGNDKNGKIILNELEEEKVDFLGKVKEGETGYSAIVSNNEDRIIFVHRAINDKLNFRDISRWGFNSRWVYISSMVGESFESAKRFVKEMRLRGSKIAFNISDYIARKGLRNIESILSACSIFILNKDEARELTKRSNTREIVREIRKYTDAIIVITYKTNPAVAFDGQKEHKFRFAKINPVDSTGAGDAFATGFVYSIIKGKNMDSALRFGHKEASSVLKHIGAKNNLIRIN